MRKRGRMAGLFNEVLRSIRAIKTRATGKSPFELLTGVPMRLPFHIEPFKDYEDFKDNDDKEFKAALREEDIAKLKEQRIKS